MRTIAEHVGVSRQTVSNAFNRPDELSPALRLHILQVSRELGYVGPDPAARALARRSNDMVGVLLTESAADALADAAASAFLSGVAAGLGESGRNLVLLSGTPDRPGETGPVRRAAVDSFICYSVSPRDPLLAAARSRGLPIVGVDQPRNTPHTVGIDDRAAASTALHHLADRGHLRVVVLSIRLRRDGFAGPVSETRRRRVEFPVTRDRLAGVEDAARDRGVTVAGIHECPTNADARRACDAFDDDATAVLALSDALAAAALEPRGRQRRAVVGLDDAQGSESLGLTSVRQPHREKGLAAAAAALLPKDAPPSHTILPTELVVRRST